MEGRPLPSSTYIYFIPTFRNNNTSRALVLPIVLCPARNTHNIGGYITIYIFIQRALMPTVRDLGLVVWRRAAAATPRTKHLLRSCRSPLRPSIPAPPRCRQRNPSGTPLRSPTAPVPSPSSGTRQLGRGFHQYSTKIVEFCAKCEN